MIEKESVVEAVLRGTKQQLGNCVDEYEHLEIEINYHIAKLQKDLHGEPGHANNTASDLCRLVSDYTTVDEKIKGLRREIKLLQIINRMSKDN